MSRLPIVGGDTGNWGTILNDFLLVSHASNGTLNSNVVGAAQTDLPSVAAGMLLRGLFSARPTASSTNSGLYYFAIDNNGGTLYQSTGSAWLQVAAGATHGATHSSGGPDALAGNLDATARVQVAKSGTPTGSRRQLNLIPGTNINVATADDSANERVDVTIGITGSVVVENGGTGGTDAATARTNLAVAEASGFAKMTVGTSAPTSPVVGDIWIDTN